VSERGKERGEKREGPETLILISCTAAPMAAVTVNCRGVQLHVAREVLHRAPLLLNACSDEANDMNEEISLDRDPEAVRMILEYCITGIITQQMLNEAFFAEADYFGVAPQLPLLQPLRET
jgi:BTB/POZ domain